MSVPAGEQPITNQTADSGETNVSGASTERLPAQIEALQTQITALMERQRALETLIAQMAVPVDLSVETATAAGEVDRGTSTQEYSPGITSRRSLLKWGGLGAAAALAAVGGSALTSQTAHAADGSNFVLGHINAAESATVLNFDGSGSIDSLVVNGPTDANSSAIVASSGLQGVSGSASAANGIGVSGSASGSNGTGVTGFSSMGYGVSGFSSSSADLAAIGTGRIYLQMTGDQPGPPKGSSVAGQIAFVPDGFFLCAQSGNPGVWLKINAGQDFSTGAFNFLPSPIRLLDTRTSGTWLAGSTHAVPITGVSVGGISVPNGAVGVVGNVTVVSPSAGGDLRVYPLGQPAPNTSSINFTTNQNIANAVTVGFGFGLGSINIKVDMPTGAHTHVLFDASAYYA